jgi:hypothetical protein
VVQIAVSYGAYYTGRIPETDIEPDWPLPGQLWRRSMTAYTTMGFYAELKKVYAERNINWYPMHTDAIVSIGLCSRTDFEAIKGKDKGSWILGDYIAMA